MSRENCLYGFRKVLTTHTPAYLWSDDGSQFTVKVVRDWLARVGMETLHVEPGSPWENGYIESFKRRLRDELLNVEVLDIVLEGKVLCEQWRGHYRAVRPHSSLGYEPPAPEAMLPWPSASFAPLQEAMAGLT